MGCFFNTDSFIVMKNHLIKLKNNKSQRCDVQQVGKTKEVKIATVEGKTLFIVSGSENFQATPKPRPGKEFENNIVKTEDGLFSCLKCGHQTKLKENLKRHLSTHWKPRKSVSEDVEKKIERTEDGLFSCGECGLRTKLKTNLIRHIERHLKPRNLESEELEKKIVRTEDGLFSCLECGHRTKLKVNLKRHVSTHLKPKRVVSEEIEKKIERTEDGLFSCVECGLQMTLKINLKRHIIRRHCQLVKCSYCRARVLTEEQLKKHMQVKHEPKLAKALDPNQLATPINLEPSLLSRVRTRNVTPTQLVFSSDSEDSEYLVKLISEEEVDEE